MLNRFRSLILCILVATSFLTACQHSLEEQASADRQWSKLEQALRQVQQLDLRGRIGFITAQERGSAYFAYSADGQDFSLEISSSFGATLALLKQQSGQSSLSFQNQIFEGTDPDQLLAQHLNIYLPVSLLKTTLLGLPLQHSRFNTEGRLNGTQLGALDFSYADFKTFNGLNIPTTIIIKFDDNLIRLKTNEVVTVQ